MLDSSPQRALAAVLGLTLVTLACTPAAKPPSPEPVTENGAEAEGSPGAPLDLANYRLVDLTYPFDEKTLYWPTAPSTFQMTVLSHGQTEGGYFYAANQICTPEHGGTHMDAPIHFAEGQDTVDRVPVEKLLAPAVVIDVAPAADADADYRLTAEDVTNWEAEHGEVPKGSIVFLRTGWSKHWPDRKNYFGSDAPGDASGLHFPSYGQDAAELLIQQRKVVGLGVDTASIDYGASTDFIVHRIASEANVFGLENVANLDQLPKRGAWAIALPMKIGGGSGGPVRIVALVPKG